MKLVKFKTIEQSQSSNTNFDEIYINPEHVILAAHAPTDLPTPNNTVVILQGNLRFVLADTLANTLAKLQS